LAQSNKSLDSNIKPSLPINQHFPQSGRRMEARNRNDLNKTPVLGVVSSTLVKILATLFNGADKLRSAALMKDRIWNVSFVPLKTQTTSDWSLRSQSGLNPLHLKSLELANCRFGVSNSARRFTMPNSLPNVMPALVGMFFERVSSLNVKQNSNREKVL